MVHLFLYLIVVILLPFVIYLLAAPLLVDAHNDVLFALGVVLMLATPVVDLAILIRGALIVSRFISQRRDQIT